MYAENLQRFEEALECYDKALGIDPYYVDAWNNKGYALQSLKREEESNKCYENAQFAEKKKKKI
jgi:tetratricopeptide (TPR) repeat protein